MHDFRRLIAWQKANALEVRMDPYIDRIMKVRPTLADQLERSVGSIASNVSEGCGRETKADFRRFLTMAIASTTETENHLIRAQQRGLITAADFESLTANTTEVRKLMNGLRRSLE